MRDIKEVYLKRKSMDMMLGIEFPYEDRIIKRLGQFGNCINVILTKTL